MSNITPSGFTTLRHQLEEAGRVVDLAAGPLYLDQLFDFVHHAARARDLKYGAVVDLMLPEARRVELHQVMIAYYYHLFGPPDGWPPEPDGSDGRFVNHRKDMPFPCTIYDVPETGYRLSAMVLPDYDCADFALLDWSDIGTTLRGGGGVAADNPQRHCILTNVGTICSDPVT